MSKSKFSRLHGSEDMDEADKLKVRDILKKLGYDSRFNMFILTPKDIESHHYFISSSVTETHLKFHKLAARPDIIAHNPLEPFSVIIEIDGAVHKKDLDSRPFYEEFQIPHIIINKEYLEAHQISWEKYLTHKLQKITC